MTQSLDEARLAVQKAREALRDNNRTEARYWAEKAAALAPQMEDPWLILATVASPRASLEYVQRALKIEPDSPRANKALQWAMQRLNQTEGLLPAPPASSEVSVSNRAGSRASPASHTRRDTKKQACRKNCCSPKIKAQPVVSHSAVWSGLPGLRRRGLVCRVFARCSLHPQTARSRIDSPAILGRGLHPQAHLYPGRSSLRVADLQGTPTPESLPTALPTDLSTDSPTTVPTDLPTGQPTEMAADQPTETPSAGSLTLSYVDDTPTSAVAATHAPSSPGVVAGDGTHWIDVNLTQQMVYAYSGNTVMNSFLVSTGTWQYPTVTGQYHIYVKLRYTDMSGPDYYLPNVPFTMYFYQSYGLHGTYWHHNFGTPMKSWLCEPEHSRFRVVVQLLLGRHPRQHPLLESCAVNCPCSPGASAFSFLFLFFFFLLFSLLFVFCFLVL